MTKDKKQILVVGVLFAVILAVGAFQFMGGSKPKAEVKEEKKDAGTEVAVKDDEKDPTEQVMEQLFQNTLVSRDPFVPQAVILDDEPEEHQPFQQQPPPMEGNNGGTIVQPFDPTGGVRPDIEPVNNGGGTEIEPTRDVWSLRGVMQGKKTLAILEDAKGNQFLVKEGDTYNTGQTRVLSISRERVELMHNGQVQTLALLGGN